MDELVRTPYGDVRVRELEQLRSSFNTSQLLTAVDDLDRFCAHWKRQLRDDLLRMHGMAHTVINDAPLTSMPDEETFSEKAFSLAEEFRDTQESLESVIVLLDQIAELEPN